jgi:hypothetical protein
MVRRPAGGHELAAAMIRFVPDSLLEALVRPVAMATPSGGAYVEIIAPDFRFIFALALLGMVGAFALARKRPDVSGTTTFALLAFCALVFVPWLATTGNGRYIMGVLLLVGPLCIGLLRLLPVTRGARFGLLGLMLALQLFLVHENAPWGSWGLSPWKNSPAFAIDVPQDLRDTPATYVTTTGISWSLVAPQFHPDARWINLSSQRRPGSPDAQRTRRFLDRASRLYLVFPTMSGAPQSSSVPREQALALDEAVADFDLRLASVAACRILPSRGLTAMGVPQGTAVSERAEDQRGFWVCPMERVPAIDKLRRPPPPAEMEAAFAKVERTCPRMFPPGSASTAMLPMGGRRHYPDSDMRLYITFDGFVWYKYMRALNGESVGRLQDVLADGFHMDCNNVRGRGMPWDRDI